MMTLMVVMATHGITARSAITATDGECELPFFQYGSDCLYFSVRNMDLKMSWGQAREACKLIGGDLAYNFSVDVLLKDDDFFVHGVGWSDPWVGASNHVAQGVYTWVDTNKIVMGPWYHQEPGGPAEVPKCVWLTSKIINDVV